MALCLSGGGYRATLFHMGAVWALKRAGFLSQLERISSASGGSVLAGLLAIKWRAIVEEGPSTDVAFRREIVAPIFKLTSKTLDWPTALARMANLSWLHNPLTAALDKHLYANADLQAFPDHPRFVITATNVQSGALWRFMKPKMRDWRVGDVRSPTVAISSAVAASAAFPPFLSPHVLHLNPADFLSGSGKDLMAEKFRRRVILTDAGVYDNLAIETAWKKYDTLLVSDAGWPLPPEHSPSGLWLNHTRRVVSILTNQISEIRQSQMKASFKIQREHARSGSPGIHPLGRKGAYWGITSTPESYSNDPYWIEDRIMLEKMKRYPTRFAAVPTILKEYLVDWGYFIAKTALAKYMEGTLKEPPPFSRIG